MTSVKKKVPGNLLSLLWAVVPLMLVLLVLPGSAWAASVTLDWDPSVDPDLAGYKVYYQANSSTIPFTGTGATQGNAPVNEGNVTSATIDGLDPNCSYYFAVTAYNSAGEESGYSNIIEIPELIAPSISFSSPAANAAVSGVVSLSASATDNVGVTKVQFFVNGSQVAETAAAPYTFSWDTSSLAPGSYTLSAKAFDAAGNEGDASLVVTVSGDSVPPVVSLSGAANQSTVGGSVALSVNASDASGVTRAELYLDGALVLAGNQNSLTYNWNTLVETNGSHTLSAKAYDAAGNVGQSAALTVTVFNDATPPAVSFTAPAAGSSAGGTVNVSLKATDNVGVARVEFYANGVLQVTLSAAPYTYSWKTGTLANGVYTLSALAYDAAGNAGRSADVAFTVFNDTVAPNVSITAPGTGATVGGTVAVTAVASDNVRVSKVKFYVNGVLQTTVTSAPYVFNWNTAGLANGSYVLRAKAWDAANNVSSYSAVTVNVVNDTVAPTISSFTLPAAANSTSVPVSLSASDNVGVTGYLVSESAAPPAPSAAGWGATAPASFTCAGTGSRTLYAWAKDAAGNISAVRSATVVIDTTLPMFTSMYVTLGSPTVKLAATATDNVGITRMRLYLDNNLMAESTNGSLASSWTFATKGTHTVTVSAYDAAGNVRSQSFSLFNQ